VEILRLVGCENLISQRKEFIFNSLMPYSQRFLLLGLVGLVLDRVSRVRVTLAVTVRASVMVSVRDSVK